MSSPRLNRVLAAACELPTLLPGVVAIALVGSYAYGGPRPDSDIDLVVLTNHLAAVLSRSDWLAVFDPAAILIRRADFGSIQERRLRLPDSTIVEVGFGDPGWAATNPVDDGTRRVVEDGIRILHDPAGLLAALVEAVDAARPG